MGTWHYAKCVVLACLSLGVVLNCKSAEAITANSLAQLRNLGAGAVSNTTITLSPTGGDPHPVTGVITPGHYWINGDHIADPTNTHPRFLELSGTGNTYDLSGATINLDTRKLDGFGRNLGHDSGVDVVRISGSNDAVQGLTLIGQDIALDTDPNAQRYADWATVFVELSGDSNAVDGAHVVARESLTSAYGPLLVFYGSGNNTSIDLELTEGTPVGTNWSAAYFHGNAANGAGAFATLLSVAEPSAIALAAMCLVGVAASRRRSSRQLTDFRCVVRTSAAVGCFEAVAMLVVTLVRNRAVH